MTYCKAEELVMGSNQRYVHTPQREAYDEGTCPSARVSTADFVKACEKVLGKDAR